MSTLTAGIHRGRGPLILGWLAALLGLGLIGAAAAGGSTEVFVMALAAVGAAGVVYLAVQVDPAWPLSAGLVASVLSGNSDLLGFPIGPDRVLIAAGLAGILLQGWERGADGRPGRPPLSFGAPHWMLLLAFLWAVGSAFWAGTLIDAGGMFSLLDRFGLVPFALFLVAPVAFRTDAQRRLLLVSLVLLGAYLGVTALLETLALDGLLIPRYIADSSVGIHADRARGPFVQAVAMGLGLFGCSLGAMIGAQRWSGWRRWACLTVAALCSIGVLFTLTRAVWLGALAAAVVTGFAMPELRRWLVPVGAVAAVLVAVALAGVPGLEERVTERSSDESPVWVRENTNRAALAIVSDRPLTGVGWRRFEEESPDYFRQADDYPLAGVGEGVHNVVLANASELGLPGTFLWLAGVLLALVAALTRPVSAALRPWKAALLAFAVMLAVTGSFGPLPYAFPLLLVWTLAGIVAGAPDRQPEPVRSLNGRA